MQSSSYTHCYLLVLTVDTSFPLESPYSYASIYRDIFINFTFHKTVTNYMNHTKQFYFYFEDNIAQDNFINSLPLNSIYTQKGLYTIENPTSEMEHFFNG